MKAIENETHVLVYRFLSQMVNYPSTINTSIFLSLEFYIFISLKSTARLSISANLPRQCAWLIPERIYKLSLSLSIFLHIYALRNKWLPYVVYGGLLARHVSLSHSGVVRTCVFYADWMRFCSCFKRYLFFFYNFVVLLGKAFLFPKLHVIY